MILTKDLIFCWRHGQLLAKTRQFLYLGYLVLLLIPFFWLWEREALSIDRLMLIDVLLGLPLVLALWVTAAIIWQGLIKTVACLFGWVVLTHESHMGDSLDQNNGEHHGK